MKILYLLPYNPVPPTFGGAIRIYHILNSLAQTHDVTVAGFGDQEDRKSITEEFPGLRNKIHLVDRPNGRFHIAKSYIHSLISGHSHWYCQLQSEELQSLINELVEENDFDIIHSEFPVLAGYDFNTNAVRILDSHNVEYDNFQRMAEGRINLFRKLYYWLESRKFYREEIKTVSRQDAVLVPSRRDAVLYDADVPHVPKYIIPNGVDLDYFERGNVSPEPYSMVFVGMMKYLPNEDAMNFFLDEIFPRIREKIPKAKIYIVGSNPDSSLKSRQNKNIEVTGFVDDVRPYIDRSSVYVVPLRMGGGTRLKILEAMAMQKPVVTTNIGCEGLGLENKNTALIADDPDEFADSVVELLRNRELASRLRIKANKLVRKKFSWDTVGSRLQEVYFKLIEKKSPGIEPDLKLENANLN